MLVELNVVGVAEGQTFAAVEVVLKIPVPLIVKLAKGVSVVVIRLKKLFTTRVPPLLMVSDPEFADPASTSKLPVMLNVPPEIVIDRALMFVPVLVPVAPGSKATSKTNPVVAAPQLAPKRARLFEPTNRIVVELEIMLAFSVVVSEFKVPLTSRINAPVNRVAAF